MITTLIVSPLRYARLCFRLHLFYIFKLTPGRLGLPVDLAYQLELTSLEEVMAVDYWAVTLLFVFVCFSESV